VGLAPQETAISETYGGVFYSRDNDRRKWLFASVLLPDGGPDFILNDQPKDVDFLTLQIGWISNSLRIW
jgi:hypothetical protein